MRTRKGNFCYMYTAGTAVQDIFFTLPEADRENVNVKAKHALDNYFTTQTNTFYERHVFRSMCQSLTEMVGQFITKFRVQAETCESQDNNEQIRDQVIEKCRCSELRLKFLEKGGSFILEELQSIARAYEDAQKQPLNIEGHSSNSAEVSRVSVKEKKPKRGKKNKRNADICFRCNGKGHTAKNPKCPARDKDCRKCHKIGHFEVCCRTSKETSTKNVCQVDTETSIHLNWERRQEIGEGSGCCW